MSELHDLTALAQAAAVRSGATSARELVQHYLNRINRFSSTLGAFTDVTATRALRAADEADDVVARADGSSLPALHGVPIAIKDLTATAGVRTTFGSAVFATFIPDVSDDIVGLLEAAGTISLGKTNAPEFGLACYTENRLGPPARTPHDLGRMAGGSSGGAAAAVAGGLLPFAHGTDGGGSLRIPAAMCGLVGLKTSRGLVSRGPIGSDPIGMSVHGPLARTTADAAALLAAMQVLVPSEPFQSPRSADLVGSAGRDPRPLKIGRTLDTAVEGVVVDPAVRRAYDATSALLADLGHEVVDIELPNPPGMVEALLQVWAALPQGTPLPPGSRDQLMPLTRHLLDRSAALGAPELIRALGTAMSAGRALARAMTGYDAVLFPTVAQLPPPVGFFTDDGDPAADFARQMQFTPWTVQINVTGQPAINVPLQWTDDGIPVGMQFVGRIGDEATLLSLCGQLERAQPWTQHRPTMW